MMKALNKKLKRFLAGRKLVFDNPNENIQLTDDETYFIEFWIKEKYLSPRKISVVAPISRRLHIDFIGYFDSSNKEILICRSN